MTTRAEQIRRKLVVQLDEDGLRAKREEKQRKLNEDRKKIREKTLGAKSGQAANPKVVPDIFKGKSEEEEEELRETAKKPSRKRRQTRKAVEAIELEGEGE